MSLCYLIANHTKKQYIDPGYLKLSEFWDTDFPKALLLLLLPSADGIVGSWCGDNITLVPSETQSWNDVVYGEPPDSKWDEPVPYENITSAIMEKVSEEIEKSR